MMCRRRSRPDRVRSHRPSGSPGSVPMTVDGVTYLDSSAIVKLVVREPESQALRRYLRGRRVISSALARVRVR